MNPALRFALITLGTAAAVMAGYAVSCLVTHVFDPLQFGIAGLVGLPAGLITARKRHKRDHADSGASL